MATIKDIAREAAVSVGTVSNVLNGFSSVSGRNREKVLAAIQKLDYYPNQIARSLRTNVSKTIGLILPDIKNPYYPQLARAVEDAASAVQYAVFTCNTDRDAEKERTYITSLLAKNVDGIIIAKPAVPQGELRQLMQGRPLVLEGVTTAEEEGLFCVDIDLRDEVRKSLELLWSQGHRRIAYIGGDILYDTDRERNDIYRQFMQEKEEPLIESVGQYGGYTWENGRESVRNFLRQSQRPTAVLCGNDVIAIGAMHAIHEAKLRIPEDVSVVGVDNIEIAQFLEPPLTTISAPIYELGRRSAEVLLQIINGRARFCSQETSLKAELLIRGSVGLAP